MADAVDNTGSDSAEKAYAAAAESAVAKADAEAIVSPVELEFPAKPKRADAAAKAPEAAAPVAASPVKLEADLVMPAKVAKPAPVAVKKPAPAKKVAVKKAAVVKKAIVTKKIKAVAAKPAAPKFKSTSASNSILKIKDTIMATKQTKDFTKTVKTAAADVSAKAKLAVAKGSALYGEASAFTKGNVEALVTSGKILGAGLQDLGKTYAAEGKSAYATVTADVKELAAVKSPVDFVRIQTSILRRNFDHAFDFGGKNSEAVLKLASEAFAPLSARASLAVEKVKKAA